MFRAIVLSLCISLASGRVHADDLKPADAWKPGLPDAQQFSLGSYVFEHNCQVCHGVRGDGRGELAETLQPKPRSFRRGVFKYGSTPPGKLPTNEDLTRVIRHGLAGTGMGVFDGRLNPAELRAVTEYIKSFSRKWRDPKNYALPVKLPPFPAWWNDTPTRAEHASAGKRLFLTSCSSCHGDAGDGQGIAAATLRDQWNDPIRPANLLAPLLHSGNEPSDLHRVLLTGIGGTPMVSFADLLNVEQRWDIVAHVIALRDAAEVQVFNSSGGKDAE
jgi:mono/diheme cytochrome c family protein